MKSLLPILVLLATCAPAEVDQQASWPSDPVSVDITMKEFHLSYDPPTAAGRVVFRALNAGSVEHQVALFQLPDDIPPIREQLEGDQRLAVVPEALFQPKKPGRTGMFAVDLIPRRRYALLCTIPVGNETHAMKGMASEFRAPS